MAFLNEIELVSAEEVAQLRQEFFNKPQACLRSSPLPKKHGWGKRSSTRKAGAHYAQWNRSSTSASSRENPGR